MTTQVIRPPRLYHKSCGERRPLTNTKCPGEIYAVAIVSDAIILLCDICDKPELEACRR